MSILLLAWLLVSLAGCQATTTSTDQLPRLLTVIEDPDAWAWPEEIVVHPDGLAYVTLDTGELVVLDGPEYVATIARPDLVPNPGQIDSYLAVHPKTKLLYWADHTGYVHVISGTKVITSIVGVEHLPNAIAIHPDTGLVYVANAKRRGWPENQTLPSNVTVISGTHIITDLIVAYVPSEIVVNPVDSRTYVAQNLGISFFDQELFGMLGIIEGLKVITNTTLGIGEDSDSIDDIAINPTNGDMYFEWRGNILYWDRKSQPVEISIKYGNGWTRDIKVNPRTNLVYASHIGTEHTGVGIIQGSEVVTNITIPGEPREIAVDEKHDYVYIANYKRGELTVIRGTDIITTLSTGGWGSWDIGVDEERGYIYVSNADSHSIAVFGFDEPATPTFWQRFFPFIQR
jgi:DNA-binding beta-propeller fold protein YncE